MLTYGQSVLLGALQGITELFPISSLGHTVILPSLFGWQLDQSNEFFVIFLVATHFATALVLLGFFAKDWVRIIAGFFRSLFARRIAPGDTYAKLGWLIAIGTVPAGLLGVLLEKRFEELFASPAAVAWFLIGNGILLYGVEVLRKRRMAIRENPDAAIAKLSYGKALGVGVMQALALFPGFSRTGSALAGGLFAGLDHEAAARFSFLLATPIIFAAAALKLPKLIHASASEAMPILAGALAAAAAAYLSVRFLTNYFKTRTLTPFAIYCAVAGIVALVVLH